MGCQGRGKVAARHTAQAEYINAAVDSALLLDGRTKVRDERPEEPPICLTDGDLSMGRRHEREPGAASRGQEELLLEGALPEVLQSRHHHHLEPAFVHVREEAFVAWTSSPREGGMIVVLVELRG